MLGAVATSALRSRTVTRAPRSIGAAASATIGLAVLTGLAVGLRVGHLGHRLWMDEGIAVGIAGHPLARIPGLLRLDGSPPLYYVALHGWIAAFGSSDVAVHALSLLLAALCVPAAWWCGTALGGRRTAWTLAALAACCPYLTVHATEARMYPLVVLLGLLCVGCFVRAFALERPRLPLWFALSLTLLLYTHNWALFLYAGLLAAALGVVAATPSGRRPALARRVAVGFGVPLALYAPWLPTLLFQARHTGAPWGTAPAVDQLVRAPAAVLGGTGPLAICVAAIVAPAAAALWRRRPRGASSTGAALERPQSRSLRSSRAAFARLLPRGAWPGSAGVVPSERAWACLAAAAGVALVAAWLLSQLSPAWDDRYLAVIVAPLLALTALGLARLRVVGAIGLAALLALWLPARPSLPASGAYAFAQAAAPRLRPGDVVVVMPFAQVPLLAHYLPGGLRYATPLGADDDPRVVDWRDVTRRLAASSPARDLRPLLAALPAGRRVLVVTPGAWDGRSRRSTLGRAERGAVRRAEHALARDATLRPIAALTPAEPRLPRTAQLRGVLLRKR